MNYIESVKEAIRKSKITQRELADNIGITLDQLTNILNGRTALKIPVRKAIDTYFYDEHDIDLTESSENALQEPQHPYNPKGLSKGDLEKVCKSQTSKISEFEYFLTLYKDEISLLNKKYEALDVKYRMALYRLSKHENIDDLIYDNRISDAS